MHDTAVRTLLTAAVLVCVCAAATACGRAPGGGAGAARGDPDREAATPIVNEERFHDALRAAVSDYAAYGEVDDLMRWVPGLCRVPQLDIHESRSADAETHGGKLFWMFAKHRDAYVACATQDQPVGQVLVKEAWSRREATAAEEEGESPEASGHRFGGDDERIRSIARRTIEKDGVRWTADRVKALYVMMRLSPDTPGTDQGWIYGTLTPDGRTVTSAGRVSSCMGCHARAPRDRMFGLRTP